MRVSSGAACLHCRPDIRSAGSSHLWAMGLGEGTIYKGVKQNKALIQVPDEDDTPVARIALPHTAPPESMNRSTAVRAVTLSLAIPLHFTTPSTACQRRPMQPLGYCPVNGCRFTETERACV